MEQLVKGVRAYQSVLCIEDDANVCSVLCSRAYNERRINNGRVGQIKISDYRPLQHLWTLDVKVYVIIISESINLCTEFLFIHLYWAWVRHKHAFYSTPGPAAIKPLSPPR